MKVTFVDKTQEIIRQMLEPSFEAIKKLLRLEDEQQKGGK